MSTVPRKASKGRDASPFQLNFAEISNTPRDGRGRHLWVYAANGNPVSKTCPKCLLHKPADVFPVSKSSPSKRGAVCLECQNAHNREKYHADIEVSRLRSRTAARKHNYGISAEDYERMHRDQQGLCAICGKPETSNFRSARKLPGKTVKSLFVDHCHATLKVRELLCYRCNTAIGYVGESVEILEAAIRYIKKHNC